MRKLNLRWVSDSIRKDYKNWKKGDTVLISAQTGTGKTFFIKNELLDNIDEHERLLLVCNRTNLKRQLKKDLLKKYNQPIPETLNELDKITTIANKVTITSYHAISNTVKEEIYGSGVESDFRFYDYIVFDECHFILSDGSFNNKTRFAAEKAIYEYNPSVVKIFISATMEEIRSPIIRRLEQINEKGFGLERGELHEYSTGNDYSYINPKYFNKMDTIINLIKNDQSKDKWLVFVSDKKSGEKVVEEIGEKNSSLIVSGTESDELNSIINNSRFTKKVLVCTKAMDNGININDSKLKNIVIMAWDRVTFIQMLGRKRIDINNADQVNLYIPTRYKKSFMTKLKMLNDKLNKVELLIHNKQKFYEKFDNDLKDFKDYNDVFYRDFKTGEIKHNPIGCKRLREDIKFCEYMIEQFDHIGKYAYVIEQLNWLGLSDQNIEMNMIEDVIVDNTIETLEDYLKNVDGKELYQKEQKELKEFVTKDFDSMIKKLQGRNKREPGLKILNKLIVICDIPYIIKTFKDKKRIEGKVKSISYWKVEKTDL